MQIRVAAACGKLLFGFMVSVAFAPVGLGFQEECGAGEDLSNSQVQDQLDAAKDRLKQKHYNDDESDTNSPTWFDLFVGPRIRIGNFNGDWTAVTNVKRMSVGGVEVEQFKLVALNLNGLKSLDPCLGKCPEALADMMDLILEHEFHNMPENAGGSGFRDDPQDDKATSDVDESDAQTPIGEVANTITSMNDACEKATEADQESEDGEKECKKSSMCALYKKLKDQVDGKGKEQHDSGDEGTPAGENDAGYADEIKKHQDSEEPDPEGLDPLPTAGENDEGDCVIEPSNCPACEDASGDSGTEGDGAKDGGEGSQGTGGTGGNGGGV